MSSRRTVLCCACARLGVWFFLDPADPDSRGRPPILCIILDGSSSVPRYWAGRGAPSTLVWQRAASGRSSQTGKGAAHGAMCNH